MSKYTIDEDVYMSRQRTGECECISDWIDDSTNTESDPLEYWQLGRSPQFFSSRKGTYHNENTLH